MALTLHQVAGRDGCVVERHRRGWCVTRSHYAGTPTCKDEGPRLGQRILA
jgi:hypothetical protein